jgi:hypothetical protein
MKVRERFTPGITNNIDIYTYVPLLCLFHQLDSFKQYIYNVGNRLLRPVLGIQYYSNYRKCNRTVHAIIKPVFKNYFDPM